MSKALAGFLRANRGSIEGLKDASSAHIAMNGTGYGNPKNWRPPTFKRPMLAGFARTNLPLRPASTIMDYRGVRNMRPLDRRVRL